MKLDLIWRSSGLPVRKIEHSNPGKPHRSICRLERSCCERQTRTVELAPRRCYPWQERTRCANTGRRVSRIWYLGHHRVVCTVLNHQVVIGIVLKLVLYQCSLDDPLRRFGRRNAVICRCWIGRRIAVEDRDRCRRGRIQIYQTNVRVGPGFHRPSLNAAAVGRRARSSANQHR
jgi:hypothetical protein